MSKAQALHQNYHVCMILSKFQQLRIKTMLSDSLWQVVSCSLYYLSLYLYYAQLLHVMPLLLAVYYHAITSSSRIFTLKIMHPFVD